MLWQSEGRFPIESHVLPVAAAHHLLTRPSLDVCDFRPRGSHLDLVAFSLPHERFGERRDVGQGSM